MAGKKRKLKKELKRKLRKETKKEAKKADERKTEKQVYDKQTLQQLMMAQMMSSRARSSNGEGAGWITTQNQANADRIRYQQEINAMKAENKNLKKQADDIEQNEKFKDIKDKYENERKTLESTIEELNLMREQAEKVKPLNDEIERLRSEIAKQDKELSDPLNKKKRTIVEMKAQLEEMKKSKDLDPQVGQKIAKMNQDIENLTKRMQLMNELNQKNEEVSRLQATIKAKMDMIRKKNPSLKGDRWDGEVTPEKIMNLSAFIEEEKNDLNEMIEKVKSTSNEVKTMNEARNAYTAHLDNLMKEHPLFEPTYNANSKLLGENKSAGDEVSILNKSMHDYVDDLGMSTFAVLSAHSALNKDIDISNAENAFFDLMQAASDKNSVYKKFVDEYNDNTYRKQYSEKLKKDMQDYYDIDIDGDDVLNSIAKGKRPSFVDGLPVSWDEWKVKSEGIPLTEGINLVKQTIEDMNDEVSVAQFGPGTE